MLGAARTVVFCFLRGSVVVQSAVRATVLQSGCRAGRDLLLFVMFARFVTAVDTFSLNNMVCMVSICIDGTDTHVRSACGAYIPDIFIS